MQRPDDGPRLGAASGFRPAISAWRPSAPGPSCGDIPDGPRSISVCMAIQSFRPTVGGSELQLERLLPHLAARGVSVTVLTRAHRDAPRLELLDGGELRRTRVGGTSPLASGLRHRLAELPRRRDQRDRQPLPRRLRRGADSRCCRGSCLPALSGTRASRSGRASRPRARAGRAPAGRARRDA